jgi:hypothetical protein
MDLANTGLSPSIAGIMGLNILAQFDVEFDFPNERISFYQAGAAAKGDCNMEGMQKLVMSFGQYSLPGLKVCKSPFYSNVLVIICCGRRGSTQEYRFWKG